MKLQKEWTDIQNTVVFNGEDFCKMTTNSGEDNGRKPDSCKNRLYVP